MYFFYNDKGIFKWRMDQGTGENMSNWKWIFMQHRRAVVVPVLNFLNVMLYAYILHEPAFDISYISPKNIIRGYEISLASINAFFLVHSFFSDKDVEMNRIQGMKTIYFSYFSLVIGLTKVNYLPSTSFSSQSPIFSPAIFVILLTLHESIGVVSLPMEKAFVGTLVMLMCITWKDIVESVSVLCVFTLLVVSQLNSNLQKDELDIIYNIESVDLQKEASLNCLISAIPQFFGDMNSSSRILRSYMLPDNDNCREINRFSFSRRIASLYEEEFLRFGLCVGTMFTDNFEFPNSSKEDIRAIKTCESYCLFLESLVGNSLPFFIKQRCLISYQHKVIDIILFLILYDLLLGTECMINITTSFTERKCLFCFHRIQIESDKPNTNNNSVKSGYFSVLSAFHNSMRRKLMSHEKHTDESKNIFIG